MSVDTRVTIAGVEFKNPIVAASGHITHNGELLRKCVESGVGAIETKSISNNSEEWFWPRPGCWFHDKYGEPGGMSITEVAFRMPEQGVDDIKRVKPLAVQEGCKIIGDISAPFGKPEKWAEMGRMVEDAGADIVEFILGCPIEIRDPNEMKRVMATALGEIAAALKETVSVPIFAKFVWQDEFFLRDSVKACEKAGIDGIHIAGNMPGVIINIETGRPVVPINMHYGPRARGTGNFSAATGKQTVETPIMSSGGIGSSYEVIERLMAGASLTFVHTSVEYKGYTLFPKLITGLTAFMEEHGYKSIDDMIGIAAPHINNSQEFGQLLQETCVPRESLTMVVDETKCTGCKKCEVCNFGAVTVKDKCACVDLDLCERCGVCTSLCMQNAITIRRISDNRDQGLDKISLLLGK